MYIDLVIARNKQTLGLKQQLHFVLVTGCSSRTGEQLNRAMMDRSCSRIVLFWMGAGGVTDGWRFGNLQFPNACTVDGSLYIGSRAVKLTVQECYSSLRIDCSTCR